MGKHRFSEKHTAQRQAVEPADQRTISPYLNAVGKSKLVELDIGLLHLLGNPGAGLIGPRGVGAGANHTSKRLVS